MTDASDTKGGMQRVEAVFHEAAGRSAAQRRAFLDEACAGDANLRRKVERLLVLDEADGGLLDSAPWKRARAAHGGPASTMPSDGPNALIGRYRLIKLCGEGGMGTVWLAERADQQFERRVALKLIKRGMDTEDILHRFRTERQILAGLNHANVASLLDGGATEDGRPYLVMEYVEGQPIDRYCTARELPTRARVKLFIKVCRAVQHAHRNLVIHRDLKPSNILVSDGGEPKLLDFGIARLLSRDVGPLTATGMRALTPLYASPEQVRGDRLTTVSDVYSLGVVLFELLTTTSPYQLTANSRGQIERAVLDQDPIRPSTAIWRISTAERSGTVSARTVNSPGRRELVGDLDTIVLKALRKQPEARYNSVEQFAEDLQRYLDRRPVLATPTTLRTRVVKTLRRNRRPVIAAGCGIILSLVVAVAVSTYIFIVPEWVQVHLDDARLELLHPHQSNAIYISVYWHNRRAGSAPAGPAIERALASYESALRLYPFRGDVRLERDVVQLSADLMAGDLDGFTAELRTHAPVTCEYAENRNRRYRDEELSVLDSVDCRSLGLLAILTGDFDTAFRAWANLDLVSTPDPFVEGLLGILYLALDAPARAYPRLSTAYRAFPDAGFLCVSLADAAAHCGDVEAAAALIERADRLAKLEDGTGGWDRVRADVLAASGRYDEAAALYMQTEGSPVAWMHHADLWQELERPRAGLTVFTRAMRFNANWVKINWVFIERADHWWAGLGDSDRAAFAEATHVDDPSDPESDSALLFAYRIASDALENMIPPLSPAEKEARSHRVQIDNGPSLSYLCSRLRNTDVKGWILTGKRLQSTPLGERIARNLAGPNRSLSAETVDRLAEWEANWRTGENDREIKRAYGFLDESGIGE